MGGVKTVLWVHW